MMQLAAGKRFLGISAKSPNANEVSKPQFDAQLQARKIKYELQRTAQSLLYVQGERKQHRVCGCHRNVASDGVSIHRKIDGSDARYGNLITCGSVWSCPVCSGKITEGRRVDMQKAQTAWLLDGGSCLLMTLTYPHENDLPLAESLEKFSKALDKFKNSRTYKRVFGTSVASINQRAQYIAQGKTDGNGLPYEQLKNIKEGAFQRLGSVRSLEVTHGVNGWHPHVHEVLFMQDDSILQSIALESLSSAWVQALLDSGLGSQSEINNMLQYGFDMRGGDYVSDYINKFGREPLQVNGWSMSHEVTKANTKVGKNALVSGQSEHFTPFQLLAWATSGDEKACALFVEFSQCFEGKRQNYWTNGLKDWFGINDKADDELAIDEPPQVEEEFVIRLDTEQWRLIIATNARFEVLNIASSQGAQGVERLLENLATRPKTHAGWFSDNARPDFNRFFH